MTIKAGELAPDFTLAGTGGRDYTLSAERGHVVVLAFYPGDETPVCTTQLMAYSTDLAQFSEVGAVVFGISPQSVESHEAFAANRDIRIPLLADPGKVVGEAYGLLGPLGFYRRSIFVVDPAGMIRFSHRSLVGATFKKTDELLDAIRDASA